MANRNDVVGQGVRVRTREAPGVTAGQTGTVLSGPSGARLYSVELDEQEREGMPQIVYLYADEFDVVGERRMVGERQEAIAVCGTKQS